MSDDVAPISREEEVLAVAMELELAVARHVQAKLLAAEDAEEINGLGPTWQRVSRSLRQTVALKAKLTREREAVGAARRPPLWQPSAAARAPMLDTRRRARVEEAAAAMRAFTERERLDYDEFDEIETYEILTDLARDETFLDTPVEALVARIVDVLGLVAPSGEDPGGPAEAAPAAGPPDEPALRDSA